MNVYTIVWETYGYEDDYFSTEIEVFETLDSAKVYFDIIKSNIIREYLEHTEYQSLEDMINDEYFYMDDEPARDSDNYFYIEYDEYGRDKLRIYKKPVMKFNLEEC